MASGGHDGRVRLWDTKSFFNFASFSAHSSKLTALRFSFKGNQTLLSSGLDGVVVAYDVVRYRVFRTMKGDLACQYVSLAIDPSGEIVCAGAFDPYIIHCFNLQTGLNELLLFSLKTYFL